MAINGCSGSRRRWKRLVAAASVLLVSVGMVGVGGLPANASEVDIYDSAAVLGRLGEEVIGAPAIPIDESELTVEMPVASRHAGEPESSGLTVRSPASQEVEEAAREAGANLSPEIRISATFATGVRAETEDTVIAGTTHDDTALYIQPTAQGVRLMTVLGSRSAPSAFTYDLSLPDGTTAEVAPDGGLKLLDEGGRSAGYIRAPWARDANGTALPTSYEWERGSLTQHVDVTDPRVAFPVVADPAWDYTVGWMIQTKTATQVRSMLKSCFSCYFPVYGAPMAFPVYNQFLPLMVGPAPHVGAAWNFNCYMDGEDYYNAGGGMAWFYYRFRSAASHVDGLGSTIEFNFNPAWNQSNPSNKFTELVVYAWIQNDNPMGIGQPAYIAGAWYNWGAFAENLRSG